MTTALLDELKTQNGAPHHKASHHETNGAISHEISTQKNHRSDKLAWFNEARFGMFLHWGLYSIAGRNEWQQHLEGIPHEEYRRLADQFAPRHYDARAWARLARESGMKYMVLTTKHHDGFCLFDTQTTDFCSTKTAAQRDFIAEYVKACREEGLKVGLYFSVKDWSVPAYFDGPLRNPDGWEKLVELLHAQVRELMTNYGKIDILWYDGADDASLHHPPASVWRGDELNAKVREWQPGILLNGRLGEGDFSTPEQEIPKLPSPKFTEACLTMGQQWCYCKDENYKNARTLLANLVSCAACGGNLLLNVGPDKDGVIPEECANTLREMGAWLRVHGEAIYGTDRQMPDWWDYAATGRVTTKGNCAYIIVQHWPSADYLSIGTIKTSVRSATLLATGQKLRVENQPTRILVHVLPAAPPAHPFNVVRLEFDEAIEARIARPAMEV